MKRCVCFGVLWRSLVFGITLLTVAHADVAQKSVQLAPGGGRMTEEGAYTHTAVGDAAGGVVSVSGSQVHQSGFFGGAVIRPDAVNALGVPVEISSDNDGDQLSDLDELTGTAFGGYAATDPNAADTDGDGMADGDEASAGFDPMDSNHRPAITLIPQGQEGLFTVEWVGRGGGTTNQIVWSRSLEPSTFTNVLVSTNLTAGAAPWFKTVSQASGSLGSDDLRYFRLIIK